MSFIVFCNGGTTMLPPCQKLALKLPWVTVYFPAKTSAQIATSKPNSWWMLCSFAYGKVNRHVWRRRTRCSLYQNRRRKAKQKVFSIFFIAKSHFSHELKIGKVSYFWFQNRALLGLVKQNHFRRLVNSCTSRPRPFCDLLDAGIDIVRRIRIIMNN